jgi:hypothetical protein
MSIHGTSRLLAIIWLSTFYINFSASARSRLTINWTSDFTEFYDHLGLPLSQGSPSLNQDGAIVQLGFFTGASEQNLFEGEWVPLTLETSIGDTQDHTGYGSGYFSFTSYFQDGRQFVPIYPANTKGTYQTQSAVRIDTSNPMPGQYLAIRFHDGTWQDMQRYNTIASPLWQWSQLSELSFDVLGIFVDDLFPSEIFFEDPANPYRTSLPLEDKWDYGKRLEGSNWYELFWFGYYFKSEEEWIYHMDYGWMYPSGNTPGSVWFYHPDMGWVWSNPVVYPWLYSKDDQNWLYFQKFDNFTWIYRYKTGAWEQLPAY